MEILVIALWRKRMDARVWSTRSLAVALVVLAAARPAQSQWNPESQNARPVRVTLEAENVVLYRGNVFDVTKIAKDPNSTTAVNTAFLSSVNIGDITSINGTPVKGLWTYQVIAMPIRKAPLP